MARIEKYSTGIMGVIKHNIREFKDGKCPTNLEVDPSQIGSNYSIVRRGDTARKIDQYRKKIEKKCFKYNRKNLIHANEVVCTLPADCPPEQEQAFFLESYRYIVSTLPMGEDCVFLAEVHSDEGQILKDGKTVFQGAKHLHVMYVPAVPDSKHENYAYRLCSDALTKRTILKQWHPKYQEWLDKAGVKATVSNGATTGSGISVKALKEISKETGMSLEEIKSVEKENHRLQTLLNEREQEVAITQQTIAQKDQYITDLYREANLQIKNLQEKLSVKDEEISRAHTEYLSAETEKAHLQSKLQEQEEENLRIRSVASKVIAEKDMQLSVTVEKLSAANQELAKAQEAIREMSEKQRTMETMQRDQAQTWGNYAWGMDQEWENPKNTRNIDQEKLW